MLTGNQKAMIVDRTYNDSPSTAYLCIVPWTVHGTKYTDMLTKFPYDGTTQHLRNKGSLYRPIDARLLWLTAVS